MDDLQRSIGRIEGAQDSMKQRLDTLEILLRTIRADLETIKRAEGERRGERRVLLWLIGTLGGFAGAVASKFAASLFN